MDHMMESVPQMNEPSSHSLPLAYPYVPAQRSAEKSYAAQKGLARGTLFPGLDLPFKGMVNEEDPTPTPLQELMALGFALQELGLYLDTHKDDRDALNTFRKYNKLYSEGYCEYERRYGPLTLTSVGCEGFDWTQEPWPWEYHKAPHSEYKEV